MFIEFGIRDNDFDFIEIRFSGVVGKDVRCRRS